MSTERQEGQSRLDISGRDIGEKRYPDQIAAEYLSTLPLPEKADGISIKPLADAIKYCQKTQQRLVIVSTVCPSYSTDPLGVPDYQDLTVDISANTQRHLDHIPKANEIFQKSGVDFVHFFLMADTEVDLLPFLNKLDISPEEFTRRCQESVEKISDRLLKIYEDQPYSTELYPSAARFLDYFGEDEWFEKYNRYLARLISERQNNPGGKVAQALEHDYQERSRLILSLLGNVSKEEGINHIARQKAQYMAFAALIRERFGRRVVVVNHRTPNFAWMNDKIVREPDNPEDISKGNFHHKLPLIELDISTLPK